MKKRRSFDEGHNRKFLLIVDDSEEVEAALYYSASRIVHSSGSMVLCYIIQPQQFQHWMGVKQVHLEEEAAKAKALFRLCRRKLNNNGFGDVAVEEVVVEGTWGDAIKRVIEQDLDVAILILGASIDHGAKGPGPIISSLVRDPTAGYFPIPITIVPGHLTLSEIRSLA